MIQKKRPIPLQILMLEAILRRHPGKNLDHHIILDELERRRAGYRGEVSIDFYLRQLPEKDYKIYHDLNLPDGDFNCQIDTLLQTSKSLLIISVKNMTGKLVFDFNNSQFFQVNGDIERGYSDPIEQAVRHQKYLKKLLADNGFPPLPVDFLITFSNSNTILEFRGNNLKMKQRICKSDGLLKKIEQTTDLYPHETLSQKDMRRLSKLLIKLNYLPIKSILQRFGIEKSNLNPGVHCPCCNYLPMKRERKNWYCPACKTFSKNAHVNTLIDYCVIYGTKITNQEFRRITQIQSPDTARRLLVSLNLETTGANKNRVYFLENFLEEKRFEDILNIATGRKFSQGKST